MYLDQYGMVQFGNGGGGGGGGSSNGRTESALTVSSGTVTVPADEKYMYTYTVSAGDAIAVSAPAAGTVPVSWLLLTVPSGAPAFTFSTAPWWPNAQGVFSSSTTPPTFSEGKYLITFFTVDGHLNANVAGSWGL